ncbi:hypothetical protein [Spongiactinospora sp. TRM90649]|nr:hypothetical protein [Spongiactinospora sp. TRM90649]MDF5754271.1 hypothetical protein [Spongiactinospora sp. TRM90649]
MGDTSIAVSADGEQTITVWDLKNGTELKKITASGAAARTDDRY